MRVYRGGYCYVLDLDEECVDVWIRRINGTWRLELHQAAFFGYGTMLASLPQEFWDDML